MLRIASNARPAIIRRRVRREWFAAALAILAGTLLLLWPMLMNGGPFFLSDTTAYVRGGDATFHRLLGPSDWSDHFMARYEPTARPAKTPAQPKTALQVGQAVTLAGRSVYYGSFLFLSDQVAGLGLVALLQAGLAAICLYLTVARLTEPGPSRERQFVLMTLVLSVCSSLAFFVGYLVPDVFTSLGILAAAHLLTPLPAIERAQKAFWFAVLCSSTLVHTSNILILMIVSVVALVPGLRRRTTHHGVVLLGCAIVIGIAGEFAFHVGVEKLSGQAPVRPPFVMARFIADGPGKAYLERHCPQSGFDLCRHLDSLSAYSDSFLWSRNPRDGVFSVVSNNERRRLAAEETSFVLAVLADRPLDVVRSSAWSMWAQATKWRFGEYNLTRSQAAELAEKLPPRVTQQLVRSRAYYGDMPVVPFELTSLAATVFALGLVIVQFFRRDTSTSVRVFLLLLLLGIVADVIVCGALSTPHDRYSTRVLWLIPVGAFTTLIGRQRRSRGATITRPDRALSNERLLYNRPMNPGRATPCDCPI